MTKFNASIAAVAAALLLSGTAFAQSIQPAAGEAPFFNDVPVTTSKVQRQDVRAQAASQMPAAGEFSVQTAQSVGSTKTRAEVRQATRHAIAQGQGPAIGMNS